MSTTITPHLNFRGVAREALAFYASVFGGEPFVMTHAQAYGTTDPAEVDLVAFGQVEAPSGVRLMVFDVPAARPYDQGTSSYFVSVHATTEDEVRQAWDGLSEGAEIVHPIAAAAWSPLYGMLTDRFGVTWVIDLAVEHAG